MVLPFFWPVQTSRQTLLGGMDVAVWRRKVIELFPQLRNDLNCDGSSLSEVFLELRLMLPEAHASGNDELLQRIYSFAEWCSQQPSKELWNTVGVGFYEHLFWELEDAERVAVWLSPGVVFDHWALWEWAVPKDDWNRIRPLLEEKRAEGERQFREKTLKKQGPRAGINPSKTTPTAPPDNTQSTQ